MKSTIKSALVITTALLFVSCSKPKSQPETKTDTIELKKQDSIKNIRLIGVDSIGYWEPEKGIEIDSTGGIYKFKDVER